ncbi:MAG: metallophosphoesterase family protein [Chloroflexota bacterium]|nr:metallophosphoesterase family protein [Chloroflexota bacterium]
METRRIGIIADIHGNLPAFEAVIAVLTAERVGTVVCLGDVAATGPQPHEVLARLRELNGPVVMGNADAALLDTDLPPAERRGRPPIQRDRRLVQSAIDCR